MKRPEFTSGIAQKILNSNQEAKHRFIVAAVLTCGLRPGELRDLRWAAVQTKSGEVRSAVMVRGTHHEGEKRLRLVPMSVLLANALRAQPERFGPPRRHWILETCRENEVHQVSERWPLRAWSTILQRAEVNPHLTMFQARGWLYGAVGRASGASIYLLDVAFGSRYTPNTDYLLGSRWARLIVGWHQVLLDTCGKGLVSDVLPRSMGMQVESERSMRNRRQVSTALRVDSIVGSIIEDADRKQRQRR